MIRNKTYHSPLKSRTRILGQIRPPDPLAIELLANADLIARIVPTAFHVSDTPIHVWALIWHCPWPVIILWISGHVRVHTANLVADNSALNGARDGHISDTPGMNPEME